MRIVFLLILIISSFGCSPKKFDKIAEEELVRLAVEDKMPDPKDVLILNEEGKEITYDSLVTLEFSGNYFEDFYVDNDNTIVQIVVRKKTPEDDILIAKINQKLNEGPELKTIDVDCDDKVNLLQSVYDRDQGMRQAGNEIDPNVDHENLEIIISFIEKCGIPTLDEVDDVQMAGMWAVLQHAPSKYQHQYIPLLEKSAENGDIKWSVIALMKDRALMYEGKPQVYGSQVRNGKLYNLLDPEYVNQRRAEIGMEALEIYLQRFGLTFNVEQKTK